MSNQTLRLAVFVIVATLFPVSVHGPVAQEAGEQEEHVFQTGLDHLSKGENWQAANVFAAAVLLDDHADEARYYRAEAFLRLRQESREGVAVPFQRGGGDDLPTVQDAFLEAYTADKRPWSARFGKDPKMSIGVFRELVAELESSGTSVTAENPTVWRVVASYWISPGTSQMRLCPSFDDRFKLATEALLKYKAMEMGLRAERGQPILTPEIDLEIGTFWMTHRGPRGVNTARAFLELALSAPDATVPTKYAAAYRLGLCELSAGHGREAEERFRIALRLKPDDAETELGLALALRAQQKLGMSTQALERAAQKEPALVEAHLQLAVNHALQGRLDASKAALDRALGPDGDRAAVLSTYGQLIATMGRVDDAVASLRRAAEIPPGNADLWYELATFSYRNERFDTALEAAEKAVEMGRKSVESWSILAELRSLARSWEGSIASYEEAIKLDKEDRRPWRSLWLHDPLHVEAILFAAKQRKDAAEGFARVGSIQEHRPLFPDKPPTLVPPEDKTLQVIRDLMERRGPSVAAFNELGYLHGLSRRFDASAASYLRAFDLAADDHPVYESLWGLSSALAVAEFHKLEEAILTIDPTRVEFMAITDQVEETERRKRAEARERAERDYSADDQAYEEYKVMRDLKARTAGSLGAVGLVWAGEVAPMGPAGR